jgi:fatty-acyl-CoA synthase
VLKTELRIRFSASADADPTGENASDAADPG